MKKSKAKRVKDSKTGEEIVIAKDGRTMHKTSLKNVDNAENPNKWKPGQSGNVNGRAKDPSLKIMKERFTEIMLEVDEESGEEKLKTWLLDLYKTAKETESEHMKYKFGELFLCLIDEKGDGEQSNRTPIIQNVIFLPEKAQPALVEAAVIPTEEGVLPDGK